MVKCEFDLVLALVRLLKVRAGFRRLAGRGGFRALGCDGRSQPYGGRVVLLKRSGLFEEAPGSDRGSYGRESEARGQLANNDCQFCAPWIKDGETFAASANFRKPITRAP